MALKQRLRFSLELAKSDRRNSNEIQKIETFAFSMTTGFSFELYWISNGFEITCIQNSNHNVLLVPAWFGHICRWLCRWIDAWIVASNVAMEKHFIRNRLDITSNGCSFTISNFNMPIGFFLSPHLNFSHFMATAHFHKTHKHNNGRVDRVSSRKNLLQLKCV